MGVIKTLVQLQVPNDPTSALQLATKQYDDTKVASVTAANSTITIAGTATAPTVAVGTLAESNVTNLTTDLAAKAPTSRTLTAGTGLTGGGDLSADRTFTVGYGTSSTTACVGNDSRLSDSRAPNGTAGGALNGTYPNPAVNVVPWAPVALTDAATILVNASLGNHFQVTLGASGHVFGTPSNPTNGQKILFEIIQDGTGSRTMTTWNSPYTFGTDVPQPTLTTTLNKRDFVGFVYNSTASLWYCLAVTRGY